jgi:hypothetical protein
MLAGPVQMLQHRVKASPSNVGWLFDLKGKELLFCIEMSSSITQVEP